MLSPLSSVSTFNHYYSGYRSLFHTSSKEETGMRRLVISYILPMTHNFKVYPNPVSETLFIETDGYEAAYELFDSSGIIIQSGDISGTNELDMKNIVPGIYNLRITDGNDIVVMKILKQ